MLLAETYGGIELPPSADFHVHLRDGPMMETVVPEIRKGGVHVVYVMPNLTPPITTVAQALSYRNRLQALDPNTEFMMTLYLHESITPATIEEASQAGIKGVKSYPAGVTFSSDAGVVSYEPFYPVFAAMEKHNLVLNLHGEMPSTSKPGDRDSSAVNIFNAEEAFLPTLIDLHRRFPKLRIVLEHCTTSAALDAVLSCSETVAATITPHHLFLKAEDWHDNAFNFCKPVAKSSDDRDALLRTVVSGSRKFFLGTDSAPHPVSAKVDWKNGEGKAAPGVFTQGYATQLVLTALEMAQERCLIDEFEVTVNRLRGFLGDYGREFYGVEEPKERIVIERKGEIICDMVRNANRSVEVVPFRRGEEVWSLRWK